MDNDGKLHKKRSDKLGVDYTREAIERTLASNRHKRSLGAQKPIMSMSDWIEAQKRLQEEIAADNAPQVNNITITTNIKNTLSNNTKKEEQDNAPEEVLTMDRTDIFLKEEELKEKELRIYALLEQIKACKRRKEKYYEDLEKITNRKDFNISDEAEQKRILDAINEEVNHIIKCEKEINSLKSSSKAKLNTSLVSTPSPTKNNDFSK